MSTETYNELVERSVATGLAFMQDDRKRSGLQFVFRLNGMGDVALDGHNTPATQLLDVIERGDHSPSTINMTFGRLVEAAIDAGRAVEYKRNDDGHLCAYFKPLDQRF